jgi:hypothetical protein
MDIEINLRMKEDKHWQTKKETVENIKIYNNRSAGYNKK